MRTCALVARHYAPRVRRFLARPDAGYMHAMGYDANAVLFSRDCERWRRWMRRVCASEEGARSKVESLLEARKPEQQGRL